MTEEIRSQNMVTPRRVLLAAHPTVGHTNGLRAIGVRLKEQGHAVAFSVVDVKMPWPRLMPASIASALGLGDAIRKDGLELLPLSPALATVWHAARLPRLEGLDELEVALKLFTTGLVTHAEELAAHAHAWRAEVVVADYLLPAALLGARLAKLPCAALYHSALPFPRQGAPFGSGLAEVARDSAAWRDAHHRLLALSRGFDARVAAAAARLKVAPLGDGLMLRPLPCDLNLLATTPALEPGLQPLEGPVLFTGPCLPRVAPPAQATHPALAPLPTDGPRVYVSLGTVFNAKPQVFATLLDGLDALGAHVIVSAGASLAKLSATPRPRVRVFERVPQVQLLRQVDFVITHGGNNTVQETLAAGRPMVVVPFGGDQVANAERVTRLGVGTSLNARQLTSGQVTAAVRSLGPAQQQRARELAQTLEGVDGAEVAAAAVLGLLRAATP
jgi:MGT family glycosyltransferase